jgi:ribosomal protein S18 acetylase RimI-like enzyme
MTSWRAARPDDDDAVEAMFLLLNREDEGQLQVGAENIRRTLAALREKPERGRVVVLEQRGRLLGYALLIPFWSNELGGECCALDELFVRPEARGQKHASALIEALAEGCTLWPRDAAAIVLEVTPGNTRAQALYRRHGFTGDNISMRLVRRAPTR